MPLTEPKARREALHRRTIEIVGYRREDGLYDIEGCLLDRKDVDFQVGGALRPAGEAIHTMWLRITVDRELRIVGAEAATEAMPYRGVCDRITPDYAKLVGLSIGPGYLRHIKELLGGVRGCTHLSELAGALATAAFQTFAGQGLMPPDRKPPQLDRCHALATNGEVVARFHPKWHRPG
jgi:Protein of unknown function (DUF2889)